MADQNPDQYDSPDMEFMVVALDLLSGLVQGLGHLVDPLVANSDPPLLSLLSVCIHASVLKQICIHVKLMHYYHVFRILSQKCCKQPMH